MRVVLLLTTVAGAIAAVWGGFALIARGPASAAETPHPSVASVVPGSATAAMDRQFKSQIQPFLQSHCYKCHGNGKSKGDVALDKFNSFASLQADLETWQSVHDELEQHDMPPEKEPQPPANEMAAVLKFTSQALDFVDPTVPRDPGFVAIHRLNRNEYNNTIRDLVGVDFHPADNFPSDDTGYGFDNIADVLSMSPLLAEKYLSAAEQVMDKAIVLDNPYKPKTTHYIAEDMTGGEVVAGGGRILASEGEIKRPIKFIATAEYEFRIEAEQDKAGKEAAKMKVKVAGKEIKTFDVAARRGRAKVYTFRTTVEAGTHDIVFAYINDFYDPDAKDKRFRDRNLYVDSLEVEGPFDLPPPAPSEIQKRLLFCGPANGTEGETCAWKIIRAFANRAYRRPVTNGEMNGLLKLYKTGRLQGESFEQACKFALTAVLVSPQFLYRMELDPANSSGPHPVSDYELASRLSYFLWSSTPDDELLKVASENKLHEPAVLDRQVKRMLADEKSRAFTHNFAGQWLELRNLSQDTPDPKKFPEFTPALRDDMREEGELFFQSIVKEDRSVLELLNSNYTYLNGSLAAFYGIDGVSGDKFQKVTFTPEQSKRRGGVLTMAAVLTVSALPNRTSPVKRGKFILDQILGTPPPAPPPGVPPLVEKGQVANTTSVRARLEQHRANPACAACHAKLDPLGFALENFDAIGRWRDKDNGAPIDNTGSLPNGEAIEGPQGLRNVLVAHKDQFLRAFVSKLMTYALGRGTTQADATTVRGIYREAEQQDCRFSTIISGIVHSDAFLKRRAKV
jgi:mono/diheme cytochrome c family protein